MKVLISTIIICLMTGCSLTPKPNDNDGTNPLLNNSEFSDYQPWWATNATNVIMPPIIVEE